VEVDLASLIRREEVQGEPPHLDAGERPSQPANALQRHLTQEVARMSGDDALASERGDLRPERARRRRMETRFRLFQREDRRRDRFEVLAQYRGQVRLEEQEHRDVLFPGTRGSLAPLEAASRTSVPRSSSVTRPAGVQRLEHAGLAGVVLSDQDGELIQTECPSARSRESSRA
jgi:hypothetical protein